MKAAVFAIGLSVLASPLKAETLSYDFSGGGNTRRSNDFSITAFDSSLGTLQEIIIDTAGSASFSVDQGFYSTDPVTYSAHSSQGLYFSSFSGYGPGESLTGGGTAVPADGVHFEADLAGSGGNRTYTDAEFLAHFIDTDVLGYFLTDEPFISFQQGGESHSPARVDVISAQGNGTITYVYAPAEGGAVPEPGTWAMMIGGCGLVGAALRTRRQATVRA